MVGPYRVRRVLASGSLGPRLLVEDARGHLQSLKLVTEVGDEPSALVDVLDRLRGPLSSHPALLPVLEVSATSEGIALLSPLVTAPSLDGRLRGGRQSLEATLDWLRPVTAGLQAAHDAGVTHGALHPRDVLVTDEGGMLTGVGLAAALEGLRMPAPIRVPYTAPERASGGAWDARADQYSLAMLALDALSGRRLIAGTIPAFDRWTLAETPSEDARLHEVFGRALHPDPEQRYASVEVWLTELAGPHAEAEGGALSRFAREGVIVSTPPAVDPSRETPSRPVDAAKPGALSLFPEATEPPDEDLPLPAPIPVAVDEPADLERIDQEWLVAAVPDDPPTVAQETSGPWTLEDETAVVDEPTRYEPLTYAEEESSGRRLPWLLAAAGLLVALGAYGLWRGMPPAAPTAPAAEAPTVASAPPPAQTPEQTPEQTPAPPEAVPVPPRATPPVARTPAPAAPTRPPSPPPAAEAPAVVAADTGRVLIRSSPSGQVTVNGTTRGATPVVLRDLPYGAYAIRITRPGFVPVDRDVALDASRPVASITVDLERATAASAAVPPSPRQAAPAVDAPPATALPAAVSPASQAPASTDPAPETASTATGSIFVTSVPLQARLFVDGQAYGSTPASVPGLAPGAHRVRVEAPGFRPWEGQVAVIAGLRARVQATLQQEQE